MHAHDVQQVKQKQGTTVAVVFNKHTAGALSSDTARAHMHVRHLIFLLLHYFSLCFVHQRAREQQDAALPLLLHHPSYTLHLHLPPLEMRGRRENGSVSTGRRELWGWGGGEKAPCWQEACTSRTQQKIRVGDAELI